MRERAYLIIQEARENALISPNPAKTSWIKPSRAEPRPSEKKHTLNPCRPAQRHRRRNDDLVAQLYAPDPPSILTNPRSASTSHSHADTMETTVPRTDLIISQLLLFSQIGKKLRKGNKPWVNRLYGGWLVMLWTAWAARLCYSPRDCSYSSPPVTICSQRRGKIHFTRSLYDICCYNTHFPICTCVFTLPLNAPVQFDWKLCVACGGFSDHDLNMLSHFFPKHKSEYESDEVLCSVTMFWRLCWT